MTILMARFNGAQWQGSVVLKHLFAILMAQLMAQLRHLTGPCANGTLRKRSRGQRSVTIIGPVGRFAPLRLRAANSLQSLSSFTPVAPPAPLKPMAHSNGAQWRKLTLPSLFLRLLKIVQKELRSCAASPP